MKSNMYEGVKTINFLNGKCPHDCVYCSTKSFRYPELKELYSGELRLNENAFKKNLGKGKIWFVCAQNDLFAKEVPEEFIDRVYDRIAEFPDNEYWFQSKNPERMFGCADVGNEVYGTTIESDFDYPEIMKNSPTIRERLRWINIIKKAFECKMFITVEPILDFDLEVFVTALRIACPDWINIGADSKKHNLPEPSKEKVLALIDELKKFTEVRIKSNLQRLIK